MFSVRSALRAVCVCVHAGVGGHMCCVFLFAVFFVCQDVGRQSDLWSVGCCVVEMGTSKPPFSGQVEYE